MNESLSNALGKVLVTGSSGFLGNNLVRTLLKRDCKVVALDLRSNDLNHENLTQIEGNICDAEQLLTVCEGIDTIFHTAAMIDIRGGKFVSQEHRQRIYNVNLEGTKNLVSAAQANHCQRLVFVSSNSVVIGRKDLPGVDETTPLITDFLDLYTETKSLTEQWVLAQSGKEGLYTCAIRPSGIWGPGDKTMFAMLFQQIKDGLFRARVGNPAKKLDNTYVHNLIHGMVLAAQALGEKGKANGEAYFINDGEPINMFEFSRPVVEAVGAKIPNIVVPYPVVRKIMEVWETLHFRAGFPKPPLAPIGIDRVGIDNYFSIAKAKRDLGYEPLFTTEQAMETSLPYYVDLFKSMD